MRSIMGIVIMTAHLNRKLKKETFDGIKCKESGGLSFKTFTGVTTNLIKYSITKFIPATVISVVSNLAPIIVVVLAYMILKEQIRKFDLLMILLTLVGIFTIILGGHDTGDQKAEPPLPVWSLYSILMLQPFLSAGGTIAMRKMPKYSDSVIGWYLQWSILATAGLMMLIMGQDFTIFGDFDAWDWLLAFGTGFTSVYLETARFKALKLHKAAAL